MLDQHDQYGIHKGAKYTFKLNNGQEFSDVVEELVVDLDNRPVAVRLTDDRGIVVWSSIARICPYRNPGKPSVVFAG